MLKISKLTPAQNWTMDEIEVGAEVSPVKKGKTFRVYASVEDINKLLDENLNNEEDRIHNGLWLYEERQEAFIKRGMALKHAALAKKLTACKPKKVPCTPEQLKEKFADIEARFALMQGEA